MTNDLTSNKTAAALLLESERELAAAKLGPLDLRTVPREQWDQHLNRDVVLPPVVLGLLVERDHSGSGFTEKEVHDIESETESFHNVSAPYHISMSITMQQTGRPWAYLMEAGEYLTGLTLGRE